MTEQLDNLLTRLKEIQNHIDEFEELKKGYREQLLELLKKEEIKSYKNDVASISYVERKMIKIENKQNVIDYLLNNGLDNFLEFIPAKLEEEHFELNKDFDDRIKKGLLIIKGVEVMTTELPQIKFN